jgi:hypothetical protein
VVHNRLRLSALALVLANLVPLAGVMWLGWSVSSIIILYWFENVVIGVVNVARMLTLAPANATVGTMIGGPISQTAAQTLSQLNVGAAVHGVKFVLIPFFIVHYFMFCAGHGIFVFSLFPDEHGYFAEQNGMELIGTLGRAIEIFSTPLAVAAAALAISHVVSFVVNYLGGGEYRRLDMQRLMTMPYGRIVVLHLTIIFGGMATMAIGAPIWLLVVFVVLKTAVDLKMHLKEHVRAAAE